MGMPQPGSPETSENAVSEGHDRSHRTSMESPKAAQPSCLRGGFIRMFLKRTDQDTEDASSSNQSTEHKHGVRGKKRKVLGANIFRLSCLRPAERTSTGEQVNAQGNKVDEQGNQAIPEEELKPYSKASFLRKIRCYRLMRERDATEKEKVVEMEQCKEVSVLEERHEKNIELGGKVTKPRKYEDTLGGKRKVSTEKESPRNVQGEKSSAKEDRKIDLNTDVGDSYKEEENKKLRDQKKTVDEKDSSGMDIGIRDNIVEHKKTAEFGNDHQQYGNHAVRAKGQKEEDIESQESHTETVEDMDNKVTKQDEQTWNVPDPGNNLTIEDINSQRIHKLENYLPEHNQLPHIHKPGVKTNDLSEKQEQKSSEDTENTTKFSPKQDNNKGKVRTKFSEQKNDGEVINVVCAQKSHTDIDKDTQKKDEKVKQLLEKLPQNKSQDDKQGVLENSFLDMGSHKKTEDNLLEQKKHLDNSKETKNHYEKQKTGGAIAQFVEQEKYGHTQKEGKAMVKFLEEVNPISKEGKSGDHLLEEHSPIKKEGKARVHFLEQESHLQYEGKARVFFLEPESHSQKGGGRTRKERKAVVRFREEDIQMQEEKKSGNRLLDHDSNIKKEEKAVDQLLEGDGRLQKEGNQEVQLLEQACHLQKEEKVGDHFKEKESHIQEVGEQKECLVGQTSNIKNIKEPEALHLQQGRHTKQEKTNTQITEQDILAIVQDHLLEETECVKEHKGLEKEVKDSPVKPEIPFTHITCTARSKEPHTGFVTFQEEESVPNIVDFNYYHKEGSQEDINDSEDDVMEDSEWKSLQVEVRGMVQWLVEEASDRLTCFTQESQGTE